MAHMRLSDLMLRLIHIRLLTPSDFVVL